MRVVVKPLPCCVVENCRTRSAQPPEFFETNPAVTKWQSKHKDVKITITMQSRLLLQIQRGRALFFN